MSYFLVHTDSDTGLDLVRFLKILGKAVFLFVKRSGPVFLLWHFGRWIQLTTNHDAKTRPADILLLGSRQETIEKSTLIL